MPQSFEKLSPEQVNQLAKTLSEAKDLTEFQAEIIDQVIKGETDIGKLRIAYLTEYFDLYSRSLDKVARRHSELHDAFLVLNNQISKSTNEYKANTSGSGPQSTSNNGSSDDSGGNGTGSGSNKSKKDRKVQSSTTDETVDEVDLGPTAEAIKKSVEQRKAAMQALSNFTEDLALTEEERENRLQENKKARAQELVKFRIKQYEALAQKQREIEDAMEELNALRHDSERDRADRIAEVRLSRIQEVTKAEIDAQKLINSFTAEIAYASGENLIDSEGNDLGYNEAGALAAKQSEAEAVSAYMQELEEKRIAYVAKLEREAKLKNGGVLSKEEATRIQKDAAKKFKLDKENAKKLAAEKAKWDAVNEATKERDDMRSGIDKALHGGTTSERFQAMKELTTTNGEFDMKKTMTAAVLAVSDLAKQLESKIDEIGGYKKDIDTRLQGSSNKKFMGSYWDQLTRDMMSVGAVTPFFKQSDFANNIKTLVDTGIAFDLKQRAFLMTIQEKIANTFNVADGTLLRLIRIQQEDSTAGRLGMESALNSFLNNMYENTEYLKGVAESVRGSLEEMESLLKGAEAAEIEYQVQKWMGSLYSVGMSQNAVNAISSALGQIAAGQIEGLTNGGAGNLLIMAANDANIPIADILTKGLDASETNKLLEATVNYLAEIAAASEDNRVVQQQLAEVFGVKASDLRAAVNLSSSMSGVSSEALSYGAMISQLESMAGSMIARTSAGEMMTNIWENGTYSVASSMAGNPVSYMIYKVAKVLDDAAGGIDLPFLNVMGFGVDLNTTVSDLMRLAAVGTGLLGSLGPMISGLASSFSGRAMLQTMGISSGANLSVTPRGSGGGAGGGGGATSTSSSGYVGNASGSDVKDATIQESEDSKKQQMIEAKEEEETNQVDVLNETVIKIYELLDEVASGKSTFTVKVEGYGLTKTSSKQNGAMAGLDAIANAGSGTSGNSGSSGGGGGSTAGGGGSGSGLVGQGAGGTMDFGGWVST